MNYLIHTPSGAMLKNEMVDNNYHTAATQVYKNRYDLGVGEFAKPLMKTKGPIAFSLPFENSRATIEEFNSDNSKRLNLEETKAKIASLEYIKNELSGIPNLV